jgi:cell division protein FtsB
MKYFLYFYVNENISKIDTKMLQEILKFFKKQNRTSKLLFGMGILIFFALYSLIGITYRNYTINQQIKSLQEDITRLGQDNIEKQNEILYYGTSAYIEKTLREKLGYQKEGERIYALPRQDPEKERLIKEQKAYQSNQDKQPNPVRWFGFFFRKQ